MLVCHDVDAATTRLLRTRSPIFDVEHLQLFSKRTASRLLSDAGLRVVTVRHFANRYPLGYWLRLAPVPDLLRRALASLGSVPLTLPAGNLLAVGVRPRG